MHESDRQELLTFVRQTPLFEQLTDASFDPMARSIRFLDVERGTGLFNQDDPANLFYIVIEGWVKVYRISPAGSEAVIGIFTRGQSFAEVAALAGDSYPANAITVSRTRLAEVPVQSIRAAIFADPRVAMTMLASVSRHVRHLVDEIEQMKSRSGTQRVVEFLVGLAPVQTGAARIRLPYEKAVIARKLGMNAESLSRVFRNLRRRGVVIENDVAVVADIGTLRRAMEDGSRMRLL